MSAKHFVDRYEDFCPIAEKYTAGIKIEENDLYFFTI